jgi:uncharacterized protein (TIGR00369 family)
VLAVSSLAAFLAFLDVTIVNIAFPAIAAEFPESSAADLSWIFTAYNVTFAALLVPAGRLADLWGRRRVFLVGLALFGVASVVCAAAPTVGLLVAGRTAQAVAAALLAPSSLALLLPAFPPERRGFAVGTWGAMGGIAAATGPALGGLVVDVLGWRAVFLLNLPVVVVTLVAAVVVMTESRDRGARLPDPAGVLLLGVGVALVAWGIVGGETSWTAPATLARLGGGLGLLAVFAWRSARVATPLVEPRCSGCARSAPRSSATWSSRRPSTRCCWPTCLFLTGVWHYDVLTAGLAVTPGPLCAATASAVGGRLADRFGARAVLVPGALLFAAGCALFAAGIGPDPAYLTHFLPATLLTGTGVGGVFSGLGVATVAALPPTGTPPAARSAPARGRSARCSGSRRCSPAWPRAGTSTRRGCSWPSPRWRRRPSAAPSAGCAPPRPLSPSRSERPRDQPADPPTHPLLDGPGRDRGRRPRRRRADVPARARRGRGPAAPIATTLGMTLEEVEEGRVVFGLVPAEFHFNPIGSVHGGVYATVLDSACGCAVHSTLPAGARYTSLDLSVKFLRGLDVAVGPVRCEGRVLHSGRRTALAEARLTDAAGRLYAHATSTCLVLRKPPTSAGGVDLRTGADRAVLRRGVAAVISVASSAAPAAARNTTVYAEAEGACARRPPGSSR